MGTGRKSSAQAAARERARAAAASVVEKENRLIQAAEKFFLTTTTTERQKTRLEEKITKLSQELAALNAPSPEAATHVQAMKNEGISNKEIATRLELSPAEVSAYLRMNHDEEQTTDPTT